MFKSADCKFTKEELEELYIKQGLTLQQLCEIVGCRSIITMGKILKSHGISTNNNERIAFSKRGNRSDADFKEYLLHEYIEEKKSMTHIAKKLGVSWVIVSRYLDKYGIPKRTKSEQQHGSRSSNWKGGRNKKSNGYIEVYCPHHPNANKRKSVYLHQLVAETMIGRYLKDNEVVHHIDGNRSNNTMKNLIVLTNSDHVRLHAMLRKGIRYEDAIKEVNVIHE